MAMASTKAKPKRKTPASAAKVGGSTRTRKEPVWVKGFLAALEVSGNVTAAARAAGISDDAARKRKDVHPEFAVRWEEALRMAAATLEAEARRRAVDGLRRYKFTKTGDPIMHPQTGEPYYELEYSDTMLALLLKAHAPERFKDSTKVEHAGKVEHQVEAAVKVDLSVLTSAELAQLMELQDKLEGRGQ